MKSVHVVDLLMLAKMKYCKALNEDIKLLKSLLRKYQSADVFTKSGIKKVRKVPKIKEKIAELSTELSTIEKQIADWMEQVDCPDYLREYVFDYYFKNKTGKELGVDTSDMATSIKALIKKNL